MILCVCVCLCCREHRRRLGHGRKKEPEEYGGYMERDEDDFLGEEEDEVESDGMIDRQKGRRLIPGCSTVSQSRLEAS